jgi:peroxiredoxin
MKTLRLFFTLFFLSFLFVVVVNAQTFTIGTNLENFTLSDIYGHEQSFDSLKGKKGTIVVFLSAQCPVVRAYNDRLNKVVDDYSSRGIAFVGINSNATESLEWVKSHAEEHYKFPVLIDAKNVLADKLGANFTPEIFLFDTKNKLLYHGAIDNDRSAKNITSQYLRTALDEVLAGKALSKSETRAFGCSIKRVGE